MADFPDTVWIRDPMIDGRPYPGGALNRGMELLDQCRDEITAIETALGTDISGTQGTLLRRLAESHAPSGLRRRKLHLLRGPNDVGGSPAEASNWWTGGTVYMQAGRAGPFTAATQTITFPKAYFAANPPQYVIAKYCVGTSQQRTGDVQVYYDQITVTTFKTVAKEFNASNVWGDAVNNYYVTWLALGGAPSS